MSKDQSSLASSKRVLPLFGWLFCGGVALVLVFCFLPKPGNSNLIRDTVPVVRGSTSLEVTATGTVTPISEIKISPKSIEQIRELLVEQGDHVKKGQVIAKMDDVTLRGQLSAAQGALLMAQDNYEKAIRGNRPQEIAVARLNEMRAKSVVTQAEHNISRLFANVESFTQQTNRDETNAAREAYLALQGAISDQDRLNAVTTARVTRAQLEGAKRELAQAQAQLAQDKIEVESAREMHNLSRIGPRQEDISSVAHSVIQAKGNLAALESELKETVITAPFDGVITQKYADTGAIVTPTTSASSVNSATSSSIVALAGTLEVVAQVAETDIANIKLGQNVTISSTSYPNQLFHGTVRKIAPEAVVNSNVTTFEVHVKLTGDHKNLLLSGMNVNATFDAGRINDVLLVPTVSVVSRHGKSGVLVASKAGIPQFRVVQVGPTVGKSTAVLAGLQEGDHVFLGLDKDQLEKLGYADVTMPPGGGPPGAGPPGGFGASRPPMMGPR